MHFFFYSSTILPNDLAHPIQILKTVRALSALPDVKVTLYCVTLTSSTKQLWERYGLGPPERVSVKPMVPHWLFRMAGLNSFVSPQRSKIYQWVKWKLVRELRHAAHTEKDVIAYTRNENILDMLHDDAAASGVPIFIELHALKYVDRFRKYLAREKSKGRTPALTAAKDFVKRSRSKERDCIRQATGVLCLTRSLLGKVAKWRLDRPITDLPSGVELPDELMTGTNVCAIKDIDILYLGQLYPWKGVDILIQAMQFLPGYNLTLVGGNKSDDLQRIEHLAMAVGVRDRVELLGQVPHASAAGYISRAKVCVIPAPRKGFPEARSFTSPMKLFEFAVMGSAIVASDLPSLREVLQHNENAWLVRPDDPAALAEGLRIVLGDEILREKIGASAREHALEYTFDRRAARIIKFCNDVDSKSPHDGG